VTVAGEAAVSDLQRLPEEVWHGASHLGVIAHRAALIDGAGWIDELLGGLDANRRLLEDLLSEHLPEIAYEMPEGTYLAWLDCRALELSAEPAEVFLDRGRIALVSGPSFGTGGAGHVRLNLATSPAILEEAVRRMASAV
jgi:cystathionine beta-lyase